MKYIIAAEEKKKQNLKISEYVYLILIYYFSLSSLNSSIRNYNYGNVPVFLTEFFPFLEKLMKPNSIDYSVSDRSVLIYFIIIDLIRRPIIPFSRIVKFNIILTYLLEFSFMILSETWEVFATKDIIGAQFREEKNIHDPFYSIVWVIYVCTYLYCASCAFRKKYPKFLKPFDKITPSIHFYLNLKRSTKSSKN